MISWLDMQSICIIDFESIVKYYTAGGVRIVDAVSGAVAALVLSLMFCYCCCCHVSKKEKARLRLAREQQAAQDGVGTVVAAERAPEDVRLAELDRLRRVELERVRSAEWERERLAEQESRRLTFLEESRLANVGRIKAAGLERRRANEVEQVRLAELERQRLAEVERERLPVAERLRLVQEDRQRLTELVTTRLSDLELTRLLEAERARMMDQATIRRLRFQVEAMEQRLVPVSSDIAPTQSDGAYIPDDRLVPMTTSFGLCPILADKAEVLFRVSLDCRHAVGAAALGQYLGVSVNSGPFPLRCPICLARGPRGGIISESPLHALVATGVITESLSRRILLQHIRLNSDQATLEVLYTTSRACPFCSIRISRYRGHACHHITPGSGCPSCHNHFCYNCLGYRGDGAVWQGCPNGCRLSCDDSCSCTDCPDCRRGVPCIHCSYPSQSDCRVCSAPL